MANAPTFCASLPQTIYKVVVHHAVPAAKRMQQHPGCTSVSIQAEPRAYVNDISLVCIIPPNSVAYFVSIGVHRYNVHQSSTELEIGDLLVRDEAYRRELRIVF